MRGEAIVRSLCELVLHDSDSLHVRCGGRVIRYREVERMCGLRAVCLRGGSFCNPGAAARAFGLTIGMVKEAHKAGRICGDGGAHPSGTPLGAVRASFGLSSSLSVSLPPATICACARLTVWWLKTDAAGHFPLRTCKPSWQRSAISSLTVPPQG